MTRIWYVGQLDEGEAIKRFSDIFDRFFSSRRLLQGCQAYLYMPEFPHVPPGQRNISNVRATVMAQQGKSVPLEDSLEGVLEQYYQRAKGMPVLVVGKRYSTATHILKIRECRVERLQR
ncbi:hypothetical protein HYS48_00490 [Candidatus Woesearchaeota archaeon]|nr:hypothetical protein [Candidatus Woesearchaeota archaeon]